MKGYWSKGAKVQEIAKQKGISQTDLQAKRKAARLDQMKQSLQNLVTSGKITQVQADARLQFMQNNKAGMMGRGHHMNKRGGGVNNTVNN